MKIASRVQKLIDGLAVANTTQKRDIKYKWCRLSESEQEWVLYRMTLSRRTPTYAELYLFTCMMFNVDRYYPGTVKVCKSQQLFPEDLELVSKTVHRIVKDFQKQKILSEDLVLQK